MMPGHLSSSKKNPAPTNSSVPLERASGLVLVSDTPKGRGVFAACSIPAKTTIEVCPVLILTVEEAQQHISRTVLDHYTYNWPVPVTENGKAATTVTQAIVFGLGSLFNHSTYAQNVVWRRDLDARCVIYSALRDIEVGEELCISYGNGHLWFEDADTPSATDAVEPEHVDGLGDLARILTTSTSASCES